MKVRNRSTAKLTAILSLSTNSRSRLAESASFPCFSEFAARSFFHTSFRAWNLPGNQEATYVHARTTRGSPTVFMHKVHQRIRVYTK